MRPIIKTTLCALVAAAVAAPAYAAVNAYLELGPIKGESAARSAPTRQLEILSWSWGATRKGWDGTIKGNATSGAKFGAVSGAHRDDSLARADTGLAAPLDRGSVRVKVKFPWLDCKVGAAFPDAVLQNSAGRYELKEVIISNCSSGGDRPTESLTLNYAKVRVRGWDPARK